MMALALPVWLAPGSARAAGESCGSSRGRWVAVHMYGEGLRPAFANSVLTDLRAELGRDGLEACPDGTPAPSAPVVTLEIEAMQPNRLRISVDIHDPSTGKPSERELLLDSVPLDGHSLAVAVAADELLASSWVKLGAPPQAAALPSAVVRPAPTKPAAPVAGLPTALDPVRPHELALLAAAEGFDGRGWSTGIDVAVRRWFVSHWAVEASVGARSLLEEDAAHGRFAGQSVPFSLRVLAGLVPCSARARGGVATALTALALFYRAEPNPGAIGSSPTAMAVYLRGELWADVAFGRFRWRVSAGAGTPLRSVSADDAGVTVGGARGLELHAATGLALGL